MILPRVIPVLLLKGKGLVKGVQFKDHTYVGDPLNAVQIFNTKTVDELMFLDIDATNENRIPSLELIQKISDECLMPFGVGGGIRSVDQVRQILSNGAEKVCICTAALEVPGLIEESASRFGVQAVVGVIEAKKNFFGQWKTTKRNGSKSGGGSPVELAIELEKRGAGEILVNNVDRDGTREGYDVELLRQISAAVKVPVIAAGGAGSAEHLRAGIVDGHCQAVAAGSMFVHHGRRRAVLISYPSDAELATIRGEG